MIEIKARVRYSFKSSLVKICSFLPAKYLMISQGILKPAAPAIMMAGISKIAWGRVRSKKLVIEKPLSIAFLSKSPMKMPFKIKFVKLVIPNVTNPSNAINTTGKLLDKKKYMSSSFNEKLPSLHRVKLSELYPTVRDIPAMKPSKNIIKDNKINFEHFPGFMIYSFELKSKISRVETTAMATETYLALADFTPCLRSIIPQIRYKIPLNRTLPSLRLKSICFTPKIKS